MVNKKKLAIVLLLVLVGMAMAVEAATVSQTLGNMFGKMFSWIQDFMDGKYSQYDKAVSFTLLFFLFTAVFVASLRKAMGKEMGRQAAVIGIIIALISATGLVMGTNLQFKDYMWVFGGLLAIILLFVIYALAIKFGMENNKGWAFFLALILTALLLALALGAFKNIDWGFGGIIDKIKGIGGGGGAGGKTEQVTDAEKAEFEMWKDYVENYNSNKEKGLLGYDNNLEAKINAGKASDAEKVLFKEK